MATVENVTLSIAASAAKPGHSRISYSYVLHPTEQDCAAQAEFTVTVGLWGEDVFDDDVLATELDEHTVRLVESKPCEPVPVKRAFEVETQLLDEDLFGDDEVFLVVEARSGNDRASGKSNTVVGDF
jgi:hypothetical protein